MSGTTDQSLNFGRQRRQLNMGQLQFRLFHSVACQTGPAQHA